MTDYEQCEHRTTRPTRAVKSNGVVCVYLQCQQCGEKVREVGKRDYDVDRLPMFDEALRDRMRRQFTEARQATFEAQRTERDTQWRQRYGEYLRSAHWQTLRRRVIARDGFHCQNCFCKVSDTTAHVHHLSYDGFNSVGHSFAFECVTLCRACHEDYHPHMQQEQRRATPPVMEVTW